MVIMSLEAARKLIEDLDKRIGEEVGKPLFKDPQVETFPLTKDAFRDIEKEEDFPVSVAFLDGGNQEVIAAPNFSAQLNRIYYGVWRGRSQLSERKLPRKVEFFSSTISRYSRDRIIFDTALFPVQEDFKRFLPDEKDLSFDSLGRTVIVGTQRADITRVATISRVFAEWQFAFRLASEELDQGDILVMDGTLQTSFKNEYKYMEKLVKIANKRGVIVSGLSKTSSLFTDTGLSLIGAVSKLADDYGLEGEWYIPVAEMRAEHHKILVLVVKLCGSSHRVFRFDLQYSRSKRLREKELESVLAQLAGNSYDISFPGYPYGLVDADRFARVSYQEVEYYRGLLLSQLSSDGRWEKLSRHMRAVDAHSILNLLVG
jgi:hypothetical protein